jgi:hypothetical protein
MEIWFMFTFLIKNIITAAVRQYDKLTTLRNIQSLLRAPEGAGIPSTLFPRQRPVSVIFQTDDRVHKDILRVYDSFVHTYPCP